MILASYQHFVDNLFNNYYKNKAKNQGYYVFL